MAEQKIKPNAANGDAFGALQSYEPPKLTNLGDLREFTLGGSPGIGDSGNPGEQQF